MRVKRLIGATFALCAIVAALALPASAAVKLPVELAAEKSFVFAKHTCAHDGNCIRYGVLNCNRQSLHVVPRLFLHNRGPEPRGSPNSTDLSRGRWSPTRSRTKAPVLGACTTDR